MLKDLAELKKDNAELKALINTHEMKLAEFKNDTKKDDYSNSPVTVFNKQLTVDRIIEGVSFYTLESTPFNVGKGINQIALSFSHYQNYQWIPYTVTVTLSTAYNTILFTVKKRYSVNPPYTHTAQSFNFQTPYLAATKDVKASVTIAIENGYQGANLCVAYNDYITMTMFAMI